MKAPQIDNAAKFGRVAVLMGGTAAEREISLLSGKAVLQSLLRSSVDAVAIDVEESPIKPLLENAFDRVFNVIHGRGGEDGVLQGVLEALQIPYTGSRVMASALSMDKLRTKLCWKGQGLPSAPWCLLQTEQDLDKCINNIGFPVIVKPAHEGSSIGMSKAENREQLCAAWKLAAKYQCTVFAEAWINGLEYTVGILMNETLPVIRLETPNTFYDYEAKYTAATTRYYCPSGLPHKQESALQALAVEACGVLGVSGWARVDVFIDTSGQAQLLEVNTVPGMTDHSLVPMAAKAKGIDFDTLVWRILETSLRY